MRILAAFDKCKGSLSAREICSLAKDVISSRSSLDHVQTMPLTDGGEGFADLLTNAKDGSFQSVFAKDSLGREKEVKFGIISSADVESDLQEFINLPCPGNIAVIEMSSIAGLADLMVQERNPWLTSTFGVGQLLEHCDKFEVSLILLGIGGSSTNDMGVGALSSLGVKFMDRDGHPVPFPSPETWSNIKEISTENLSTLPPIRIACDVSNQLLGEGGATYQFGLQKGLYPDRKQEMEEEMLHMSAALATAFQKPLSFREQEGSGAAGGVGYGLSLAFDTSFVSGFSLISKWFNLEEAVKESDLILTGEGRFDRTSLYGKGPFEIIRMASNYGKNIILLAGSVESEAVEECKTKFPNIEVVSFGNAKLSLNENLKRAPEFFSNELLKQLSNY
jgi:glycerate kinase